MKRGSQPPPSKRTDQLVKLGLAALVALALAITFWPENRDRPAGVPSGPDPAAAPPVATAPAPAPAAPTTVPSAAVPSPDLDRRAEELLFERLLASESVPEITRLANEMLSRNEFTNAARLFRRTVELDPENETHHFNLGIALGRLQKPDEAIAEFRSALQIYPDYAEAHNSLGLQLAVTGNLVEAARHFETALQIQPDLAEAANNLGTVQARRQQYPEALASFEKALAIDTNHLEARFNVTQVLLKLGQTNEAIGRLHDLINLHPDYEPAQIVLFRLQSAGEPGR